jgi:hypothetical protein
VALLNLKKMNNYQNLTSGNIEAMRAEVYQLFKNSDQRSKEWNENFEKEKKESDQRLEKLERLIGGIGNSNGEMAEEFFYNTLKRDKTFVNEQFDMIKRNYFYYHDEISAESDIVLFNGTSAAIIEVKYNAKPDNVDIEHLISRVSLFKKHSPEYKNHKIYLGVAAMSFKKGFALKIQKAGIATIRPVGKKIVVYDKSVKVF